MYPNQGLVYPNTILFPPLLPLTRTHPRFWLPRTAVRHLLPTFLFFQACIFITLERCITLFSLFLFSFILFTFHICIGFRACTMHGLRDKIGQERNFERANGLRCTARISRPAGRLACMGWPVGFFWGGLIAPQNNVILDTN